ncbi:MAG: response regulator [Bacilli bacterium]
MEFGIVPIIASLAFLIVLILVYNSKKQINDITNKIFKIYIYISLTFCVTELLFVFTLTNIDISIISKIIWKIHWLFGCSYWGLLFLYLVIIIKNIEVNSFKEVFNYDKVLKIILILFMIVPFTTLIVPSDSVDIMLENKELIFSNKRLDIFIVIYCSIILISIYSYYLANRKKVSKTCRFSVYITIINSIFFIISQILLPNISLYFELSVVMAYILYFNFANPDIGLMKEINLVQKDIEKINKTKTDFLSNMSYEIKIPIDLITNLCNDISTINVFDQEMVKKDLKQIIISGNNLLEIVNNVLDISKIESGRNILIEKEYNLKEMIDDISSNAISRIGAKNVEFKLELDENISSTLIGDYSKLYRAVLNIVNNAAKFTEVGKVVFSVTSNKNGNYEKLLFKVSDTGNGIKEEDKNSLFSKGVKLKNNVGGETEGSGFGLSISKDYIDALGGKIWFESEYRVGSTFYIEVSQKIKDSTPIGQIKSDVKDDNKRIDCTGKTVLIVDDNKPNIKVVKRLLEKYNFKVDSVLNGQDCIYKIKSEIHYDLIFMDHIMEGMDGIETLHVLKSLKEYNLPPVIALTANAMSDTRDLYIKEGFDGYLSKPVTLKDLDKVVNKYFNNK